MECINMTKRPEKDIPIDITVILAELRDSILKDKNLIQRKLGLIELENPSTGPVFEITQRGTQFEDMLLTYTAEIHKDKIGVDFMTNQQKYRTREVFLEAGKTLNIHPRYN